MVSETNGEGSPVAPVAKKRRSKKLLRFGMWALLLLFVFSLGMNFGNGRLHIGNHQGQTGLPAQLDYSSVNDVYDSLKANYNGKLNEDQILDGLKHGVAEATNDPYTEYFTAKEAKEFKSDLNNSFSGIGAELGQDSDKNITVVSPIDGFPAQKAGLKAQDIIVTVNGESTQGWSIDKAVSKVRGKEGTTVKLGIVRDKSQALTLDITRETIKIPSVKTKILDGNIGYMQITTFADDTSDLAQKAALDFKDKGVKGVVLDLRNDPGGYLDAAVDVSSLWVQKGKLVVDERGTNGDEKTFSKGENVLATIPTVVLINGGSASASEITAGALHDNKEAYVIGEKSYGKGVVQQLVNFPDGSELKVTVASWYRPNGQNINHKGISPDLLVKISDDDAKAGTDTQLNAAQTYLNR
jgi:carboxyl-terminal processing protease